MATNLSRHTPVRSPLRHPEWTKDAAIYQLNQRQATPEGTLRAAQEHLPRIKDLGFDIVWLMPIHPIGEHARKGGLGSPYAVRDYFAVNPEFGDHDDLVAFVATAHRLGLRVILDWVANHTAWDNPLVEQHPEWYARDWKGDFRPTPWWDWDDIIDLDYDHVPLREYMSRAMCHWVREADVDGFRCDVAGFVPLDFWEQVRRDLEEIKPVFLLAEWETRDLHHAAFDASYAWSWHAALQSIASGRSDLEPLRVYYAWNTRAWPQDAMRMTFVTNHDMNAFEGTEFEQFGEALTAVVVLSVVGEGIPMLYSGQESGHDRRLRFFDKDEIEWGAHEQGDLYRRLLTVKKQHPALWNGAWGARMERVTHDHESAVLAFVRSRQTEQGRDRVFAAFNFSDTRRVVTLADGPYPGRYERVVDGSRPVELAPGHRVPLEPWGYVVLVEDAHR